MGLNFWLNLVASRHQNCDPLVLPRHFSCWTILVFFPFRKTVVFQSYLSSKTLVVWNLCECQRCASAHPGHTHPPVGSQSSHIIIQTLKKRLSSIIIIITNHHKFTLVKLINLCVRLSHKYDLNTLEYVLIQIGCPQWLPALCPPMRFPTSPSGPLLTLLTSHFESPLTSFSSYSVSRFPSHCCCPKNPWSSDE